MPLCHKANGKLATPNGRSERSEKGTRYGCPFSLQVGSFVYGK